MPDATLTITIREAQAVAVITDVCNEAGVPVSVANAQRVAAELLRGYVEGHRRRTAAIAPVEVS